MAIYTPRVYRGLRVQRGHGIGALFSSIFRRAKPILEQGIKYLGKKALNTGIATAQDILGGKTPKHAFEDQVREVKKVIKDDAKQIIMNKIGDQENVRKQNNNDNKNKLKRMSIKSDSKRKKRKNKKRKIEYDKNLDSFFT